MSGVTRFLSKRDRNHKPHIFSGHHSTNQSSNNDPPPSASDQHTALASAVSAQDLFGLFNDTGKSASKDEASKVKIIRDQILISKSVQLSDGHILWALRSNGCRGDKVLAYELLIAISNASEGLLTTFNPNKKIRGAVNRSAVTCFLDSTLFSMFFRLDSFEAMLYNTFSDPKRQKLAFLLRLWVNLLRSGQLIETDITKEIQNSLAECGWEDAKEVMQQDASEAFTFITEQLQLPLLTLKVDTFHTGRQDSDDHKYINERLLEVAIPTLPDGSYPREIKLEDCLEEYFNNRIEVKRYLERRNTLSSTISAEKKDLIHVETVEVIPESPGSTTPVSSLPSYLAVERPINRTRTNSIIQQRYIPVADEKEASVGSGPGTPLGRMRTGSLRKEVQMPAWQFMSILPWYTSTDAPSNDAQVAAHFSSKRPVLGLCLKRYAYTKEGKSSRLDTAIDIPIEIALPHFIQDNASDVSLAGNFKLSLQSVVCHRGTDINAGHYIALARNDTTKTRAGDLSNWVRFDDLASQRVSLVDIHKAMKEEAPYLLLYQILPVDGDPGNLTAGESEPPPSYTASTVTTPLHDTSSSSNPIDSTAISSESQPPSIRASFDDPRGRSPAQERRASTISFSDQNSKPRPSLEGYRDDLLPLEHKKTGSSSSNLGRTLSRLSVFGRKQSAEETPRQNERADSIAAQPQIFVQDVSGDSTLDTDTADTTRPTSQPYRDKSETRTKDETAKLESKPAGIGRSHSKRDKSKSRLSKFGGKNKDDDRECTVM